MELIKKFLVFPTLFVILISCRKPTSANWDVDVVLPVVNSVLNIKNFLGDTLFKSDDQGLLHFYVNREVFSIKLDSLLSLPDTSYIQSFPPIPFPFTYTLNPGQSISNIPPSELKFNIGNGVSIKRAIIRSGVLTVKFSNDLSQPLDLVYEVSSAKKNDSVLKITETIPPGNNSLIKSYNLAGYDLNLRGMSGNIYNTLVQKYNVALSPNATLTVVDPGKGAKIELSYTKIVPEFVEGYFGQQTISIPMDTAKFGLIDNFQASNFMLTSASLAFKIVNEFGAEFTGNLSGIKSINTTNNTQVSLNTNQLSNININRASRVAYTVYPSIKALLMNNATSNVTPFISNLPDKLTYGGQVNLNPLGNISGYNDFAFYNTGIKVIADIDIPMRFSANYFRLKSITKTDFANVQQLDNVNNGNFIISASNGYPFQAKLQAYLLDEQNKIVDSLFVQGSNVLERGQLNSANEVTFPTQSRLSIPISPSKIANLKKCKSIEIISYFIMPASPPDIKLLENYQFDVNIIAELNYNVGVKSN